MMRELFCCIHLSCQHPHSHSHSDYDDTAQKQCATIATSAPMPTTNHLATWWRVHTYAGWHIISDDCVEHPGLIQTSCDQLADHVAIWL